METEPPERIWTCNETLNIWIPEKQEETVEYVRSDIVAALRAELATARNDGLEAAARVAEENAHEECEVAEVIAAAIRAMKETV